jgi:Ca2+-binding EF-hand superfamily protein
MLCCGRESVPSRKSFRGMKTLNMDEQEMLKKAAANTRFSVEEVLEIYADYCTLLTPEHRAFGISKPSFVEKTKILSNTWSTRLAEKIFEAIDKLNPDFLRFPEFLSYLNILYHGDQSEKLRFSFKIMDKEKKNYLTRQDIGETLEILLNIHAVLTGDNEPTTAYINSVIDYIMHQFDSNKNNKIELGEFSTTSMNQNELFDVFQILSGASVKANLFKKGHDKELSDIYSNLVVIQREYDEVLMNLERIGYSQAEKGHGDGHLHGILHHGNVNVSVLPSHFKGAA